MITKAIDVIQVVMSDDCVEVLEAVEKRIQEIVGCGRDGFDTNEMIVVTMPVSLTDQEESCVRQVMYDKGWKNVYFANGAISFYFPH